jgi:hypothetical protein
MRMYFSTLSPPLALISWLCLSACEGETPAGKKSSIQATFLPEDRPSLMPLDALVGAPGDTLTIKGKELSPRISLFINDKPAKLKILDREHASFSLPEDDESELYRISFKIRSQTLHSFSLAKSSTLGSLLERPIALDFVCDSLIFKDQNGTIVRGQAKCDSPTLEACSTDGEVDCKANEVFKAANTIDAAEKILSGKSLAGVSGSAPLKPADCASDGEGGCVVDGLNFKAAKLSLFSAYDIRSSARIAGVQGGLPNCSSDGEIGCLAVGPSFAAASLSGAPAKILSGQVLGGIIGTVPLRPADCAMDNDFSCVATPAFPAVVKANVTPGLIKEGSIIAGVNGAYPSAAYPLASNTATTDLTLFQSQLTSNGAFEFFDSAGSRYTGSGDSDLVAANLRLGTVIESLSLNGTMPAVLPPAPTTLTSIFFTTPDRIVLNWTAAPGAAGYILVARSGGAVTFVPARTQTYSAGAQGSDNILYVGTDLTFVHNAIISGNSYNYAVYSYDSNRFYSAVPARTINTSLFCQGLAGGSWVAVPGDASYGTSDFCVQKFEAKDVGGVPTSQASLSPWVNISQTASISVCRALGPTYDLISNDEWLTITANIAQVASNWSSGTVGVGTINRGHSDNNPGSACAASSDDTLAWVQTDCTPKNSSGDVWNQKRTHTLSTGGIIWDLAGNVWDWTNYVIPDINAKPFVSSDGAPLSAFRELMALDSGFTSMPRAQLTPTNAQKSFWNDSWASSVYGMGQYNSGTNGSGGALRRGAVWSDGLGSGVFAADLLRAPSFSSTLITFRCVARPPSL